MNVFLLACQEFISPYWLTYKQCSDLGGQVRHGSKSTPVVFWKMLDKNDEAITNNRAFILKYYNVFNAEQCEGITTPPVTESVNSFTPIEKAEQIVSGMPLKPEIKYSGFRAFYSPSLDYIQLPQKVCFDTPEEYYNTAFHECVHASGHSNRLARKSILEPSYFGSQNTAKKSL